MCSLTFAVGGACDPRQWSLKRPIAKTLHDKSIDSAAKLVTDEIQDKLVIAGNPNEVTEKLLALAECGLRLPLLYQVLGPERETAVRLIADQGKPVFDEL
mgnify:CR=1 FL=1